MDKTGSVEWRRCLAGLLHALLFLAAPQLVFAERIQVTPFSGFNGPGAKVEALPDRLTSFSILASLSDNVTPLTGYSLDLVALANEGSVGSVVGNADLTNLFEGQNLLLWDGGALDEGSPVIRLFPGGRVFISALTEDLSPVALAGEGHDVLAEVFFDVLPGTRGFFTIMAGPVTVLVDESLGEVPFVFEPLTVEIVPEPATSCFLALGITAIMWQLRKHKRARLRGSV